MKYYKNTFAFYVCQTSAINTVLTTTTQTHFTARFTKFHNKYSKVSKTIREFMSFLMTIISRIFLTVLIGLEPIQSLAALGGKKSQLQCESKRDKICPFIRFVPISNSSPSTSSRVPQILCLTKYLTGRTSRFQRVFIKSLCHLQVIISYW